jgi:hypothetical protein
MPPIPRLRSSLCVFSPLSDRQCANHHRQRTGDRLSQFRSVWECGDRQCGGRAAQFGRSEWIGFQHDAFQHVLWCTLLRMIKTEPAQLMAE